MPELTNAQAALLAATLARTAVGTYPAPRHVMIDADAYLLWLESKNNSK